MLVSRSPEFHDDLVSMLDSFGGHTLENLGGDSLMRRFDLKFVLPLSSLPGILRDLASEYTALDIDGRRLFRYESHYFDTPSMDFFRMHHNGQLNRYKVRQRVYADSDTRFLEVKFKSNQRRTTKTRIETSDRPGEIDGAGHTFLSGAVPDAFQDLVPSLSCAFRRIALTGRNSEERVTLDFDLSFRSPEGGGAIPLSQVLVVELKQERPSLASPLFQVMRKRNVRPQPFSKYCIGCCLAERVGKINRFKPTLARVREISEAS